MQLQWENREEFSQDFKETVARLHADAIIEYIQEHFDEQEGIFLLRILLNDDLL